MLVIIVVIRFELADLNEVDYINEEDIIELSERIILRLLG